MSNLEYPSGQYIYWSVLLPIARLPVQSPQLTGTSYARKAYDEESAQLSDSQLQVVEYLSCRSKE